MSVQKRNTKNFMSQSSPWKWLLARCNTWLAAVSGDSWKAGYTKWSQSSICPSSSRTIFSWISEDTFTKSPIWVWIFVLNIDGDKSPTMWINTQIFLGCLLPYIRFSGGRRRFVSCHVLIHVSAQKHVWCCTTRGRYRLELLNYAVGLQLYWFIFSLLFWSLFLFFFSYFYTLI